MKNLFLIILTCFITVSFSSCEDEKSSVPPTFKGFTCAPNPVHPGDTLVVRLYYASKGEYVHSPRCNWTLTLDTLSLDGVKNRAVLSKRITASIASNYLSCPFIIPQNAATGRLITCHLDVTFDNSVDTQPGLTLPNVLASGFLGSLGNSTVASTLYSKFSGNVSIGIVAKN